MVIVSAKGAKQLRVTLSQKKQEQREIRLEVLRLIKEEENFKKHEAEYKERKRIFNQKVMNYFEKSGFEGADLDYDEGNIKLTMVNQTKIEWDIEKLKKVIDRDIRKKVIEQKVIINDYDNLVKLLKQNGVSPKQFKQCITVEESLDEKTLENCLELGEITKRQIKGTYKLHKSSGYVRITDRKKTANG